MSMVQCLPGRVVKCSSLIRLVNASQAFILFSASLTFPGSYPFEVLWRVKINVKQIQHLASSHLSLRNLPHIPSKSLEATKIQQHEFRLPKYFESFSYLLASLFLSILCITAISFFAKNCALSNPDLKQTQARAHTCIWSSGCMETSNKSTSPSPDLLWLLIILRVCVVPSILC